MREPRRLVYYLDAVGYGGAVNYVERLVAGGAASDFETTIIAPATPAMIPFRQVLAQYPIHWIALPDQPDIKQSAYHATVARGLGNRARLPGIRLLAKTVLAIAGLLAESRRLRVVRSLLRGARPDVLHVNLDRFPDVSGKLALLAGRDAGAAIVLATLHRPPQAPVFPQRIHNHFDRKSLQAADRIIVVAEKLGRELAQWYGAKQQQLSLIPNGAARDCFDGRNSMLTRRQLGFDESDVLVAHVGSVGPWRGQLILARALTELRAACPRLRAAFVGGVFDAAYAAELESVLTAEAAAPFRWLGHRPDATEILRLADIVVLSSFEEGHSFALLEAMALGKAIVATDLESNVVSLAEGLVGKIVPVGDVKAMADAIRQLYLDADLRARIGVAAKTRATRLYTEERMVRETLDVYRSLAATA